MNGIIMMIIAIIVLGGAYLLYGRYLERKWGIDPNAKTPAYELQDGVDYVPADTNVVFGHQFASIAGAGPINGPIQAAMFGWLPVLLWILIGGVFFGAVQDFAAMYASVKNKGRTIGYIIEAVHRQARQEAVPAVLLAVLHSGYRGVCGRRSRYVQRLCHG